MKTFTKFWLFLFVFCLGSAVFVQWAYSEDMLIENSIAHQKNVASLKDLSKLFSELGVMPLSQIEEVPNGTSMINPCFDLEGYTRKYCTPHGLKLLLNENAFSSIEEQLFRKFLKAPDACEQVAQYIGRICELNNFKKIIKHFALEE